MAKMYPKQLDSKASPAVRTIYKRLDQGLSDDFTVIQGISFSDPQDSANRRREIGFLVVHPDLGLLVIEVVGGAVQLADNLWHSRDAAGNDRVIANPYLKAKNDRAAFSRWLRQDKSASQYAMTYNRHIGYAVALPDTDATQANLGLTASPRNTIDRNDLANPDTAVRRVMEHAETNYQIPPQAIGVLVATLVQAQTTPRPSVNRAPPALQRAGATSMGGVATALLVTLVAVALLAVFLIFSRNQTNPPPIVAKVNATATPSLVVVVLATTTPTAAAQAASATPLVAIPTIRKPTPVPRLAIGADALVSADGGLLVREQPSTDAAVLVTLGQGVKVHITDGPQQANGFTWWKIANWPQANGVSGWCAGDFLSPIAAP